MPVWFQIDFMVTSHLIIILCYLTLVMYFFISFIWYWFYILKTTNMYALLLQDHDINITTKKWVWDIGYTSVQSIVRWIWDDH